SPWVVLETPPGSCRRSSSSGRSAGSGLSATRRTSSATGAAESTRCPVGSTVPSSIALRARTSTGCRPHASASLSNCDSYANPACTAPNPRIAPQGGLLVTTPHQSILAFGTSYGPIPSAAALPTTAGVDDVYAPPSR